jgi:AsmA protein
MPDRSTTRPDLRRAKAPLDPQGSVWLAYLGYGALGLGCLLVAAVTFLLVATPVDLVRDQLIQQVKAQTGRDLSVSGGTSLVFFPRVAISLANVAFSAPPDMGGAPTLVAQRVEAELGLASLLNRQAGIKRIVVSRPVVELRVDAQGRRSWDFAFAPPGRVKAAHAASSQSAERPRLIEVFPSAHAASPRVDDLAATLDALSSTSLRIDGGTVRYVDERHGLRQDITALDMDIALNGSSEPLQAKGSLAWRGEKLALESSLWPLRALVEDRSAKLSFKLAGRLIEVSYNGTVDAAPAAGPALAGNLDLKSPSIQALGTWAGSKPVAGGGDLGALAVAGSLTGSVERISLASLNGTVGASAFNGDLTIESRPARAYVNGTLRLSQFDLGGILIHPGDSATRPDDRQPPQTAPQKVPQVRGFTKRTGDAADWSDDVLDLAALSLADADLALSTDRLIYKDVKTGPVRLALQIRDNVAKMTLEEMQLYEGRGRGVVTLDGRGQAPATAVNLVLEGIAAQPLLKDALGFEWLEGRSNIAVALTGQGLSERQIVGTLNGKVSLATTNGTIEGADVTKMLRGIEQGRFGDLRVAAGEKTQFSELAGTFNIVNGVADNRDLRLVSPAVRITGEGSFNLASRAVDYTVRPKVSTPNSGTDRAVVNLSNVDIPVRIEGSWDKPNFTVAGQEKIVETIKEIGKNLKSDDVKEALKGLLGGGDGDKKVKPRDILEKLLKKQ